MTILDYNSGCVDCDGGRDEGRGVFKRCQDLFCIVCWGKAILGGKERKSLGLREESKIFQQLSTRN